MLPEEVLTTTLIHHQHYFPVEDEDGKLKPAFLAVINTEPDNERTIARNAERVVTVRPRDARFFWEADRKFTLESRIDRLGTLLFHKKLGTYKEKAERIEKLAAWIAKEALGALTRATAKMAGQAARLAKADLATDMVREVHRTAGARWAEAYAPAPRACLEEGGRQLLPLPAGRRRSGCAAVESPARQSIHSPGQLFLLADNSTRSLACSPQVKSQRVHAIPTAYDAQLQGVVKTLADAPDSSKGPVGLFPF